MQEPHSPCSQAFFEPGQAEPLAQHVEQALARPHVVGLALSPLTVQVTLMASAPRR